MKRRVMAVVVALFVAAVSGAFFAGRAYSQAPVAVNLQKELGTFKGTMGNMLIFEDKAGTLWLVEVRRDYGYSVRAMYTRQ